MPKLTLKKTPDLVDQLISGDSENEIKVISNEIVDKSRWTVQYELLVKIGEKFYRTFYERGATEYQDNGPWECDDKIELIEVEPREVKTIQYFPVKD